MEFCAQKKCSRVFVWNDEVFCSWDSGGFCSWDGILGVRHGSFLSAKAVHERNDVYLFKAVHVLRLVLANYRGRIDGRFCNVEKSNVRNFLN